MWYVSEIICNSIIFNYIRNFTKATQFYGVTISNTENKYNFKLTKDMVDWSDINAVKMALSERGIAYVFGFDFNEKSVFSTTEFGMQLYQLIDYEGEKSLEKYFGAKTEDFVLVSNYIIFRSADEDLTDFYTTLDRIILYRMCIIDYDKIYVCDYCEDYIMQVYKVLNVGKFTKLLMLKSDLGLTNH